jgi:hypothetical protein
MRNSFLKSYNFFAFMKRKSKEKSKKSSCSIKFFWTSFYIMDVTFNGTMRQTEK